MFCSQLRRLYLACVSIGFAGLLMLPDMQAQGRAADLATLFQDARTVAGQLRRDSLTMETYTRSGVAWQSHAAQIELIKQHINKAGSILSDMQAARGDAKPWHQETIDRITPVLKQLADNTTAIIDRLNSKPTNLRDPKLSAVSER
jgi:hypothetical protein